MASSRAEIWLDELSDLDPSDSRLATTPVGDETAKS